MTASRRRLTGIALTAAGSVLWSTGGLFSRVITLDLSTTLFWRSAFAALSLFAIVVLRDRRNALATVRSLGWTGVVGIPISAIAMLGYVAALKLTTVANVMIVYATLPFVAAGIAFLWIGERTTRRTLVMSGMAFVGVVILAGLSTGSSDLLGDGMTLLMTVTFGVLLVMARRHPGMDMAPLNGFAALLCVVVCWPLSQAGLPSPPQLLAAAGFGIVCTGLAFLLFLTGSRYIPSSEAGLLGFLDVILGPFWMWLVFDERPDRAALVGGTFVLAAVIWYLVGQLRSDPQDAGETAGKAGGGATVRLARGGETA